MRGSPEHLILQEAQALVKDRGRPRQGSDHIEEKAWSQVGDLGRPGGKIERQGGKDQTKGRIQNGRNTTSGPKERERKDRKPRFQGTKK